MNKELQTVFNYHQTTKHAPQRYARSLGYMDWSTQPNPFRDYKGAQKITLNLAMRNATPPYHLLDTDLPSAPLLDESLSQLLQFSMGIAAHKESGGNSWAVRCNASSGNLHPTETYLVLPPIFETKKCSVMHYTPKTHGLEVLSEFDSSFFTSLPQHSFLLGFSSITWREVWKYGERAFRYTQLDAGHAWQSLVVSAKMLGWKITRLDSPHSNDINTLFGLKQKDRFFENENADMLFVVSPLEVSPSLSIDTLLNDIPLVFEGIANKLSPSMQNWDIISEIEDATTNAQIPQDSQSRLILQKEPSYDSKEVILKRRSIHIMHKDTSLIDEKEFITLLQSVSQTFDLKISATHLVLFVHRVKNYVPGLYIFVRNIKDLADLKNEFHEAFLWEETKIENLYFLEGRNLQMQSKAISCAQDIASDGAFSLGMLCNFSQEILTYGAHRYKELYWECGMIGQELYLESTSLGLSGTGIGCFLDDTMHSLLGIKNDKFQVLYHFTIGRGNVDSRIMTTPAYNR